MGMPIATMDCEDCGTYVIAHQSGMTVFVIGRDVYAVSICGNCARPTRDDIEPEDRLQILQHLLKAGVTIFSWHDGREIKTEEMLEAICA